MVLRAGEGTLSSGEAGSFHKNVKNMKDPDISIMSRANVTGTLYTSSEDLRKMAPSSL